IRPTSAQPTERESRPRPRSPAAQCDDPRAPLWPRPPDPAQSGQRRGDPDPLTPGQPAHPTGVSRRPAPPGAAAPAAPPGARADATPLAPARRFCGAGGSRGAAPDLPEPPIATLPGHPAAPDAGAAEPATPEPSAAERPPPEPPAAEPIDETPAATSP